MNLRTTTAYFAGIGTVVAAVAGGLGGGLLLGDIMSPQQPKHPSSEVTRLEQRASPRRYQAMNGATQPVPYVATTQAAATVVEPTGTTATCAAARRRSRNRPQRKPPSRSSLNGLASLPSAAACVAAGRRR